MNNDHPYKSQPKQAFWRSTVAEPHFLEIENWYTKKWAISSSKIAAGGSCFAQHIGRHLQTSGFKYIDQEPAPSILPKELWNDYGYGMYSARYGNIYSPRQLLQLIRRATGEFTPKEQVWEHDGGFVDPFRPTIEPQALSSAEEVLALQKSHLNAVVKLFESIDVFIFTLGLTEIWTSKEDGAVYPICPGVSGGQFDPARHEFVNLSYPMVRADLEAFFAAARAINPRMKFLLTVSPVPLMATATAKQVAVATMYSKSVLRSVAGYLADRYPYVDYFPSYEIISSHVMRGNFFQPDMRSVVDAGVEHVMKQFFKEHTPPEKTVVARPSRKPSVQANEDVVCDEELLSVFGPK